MLQPVPKASPAASPAASPSSFCDTVRDEPDCWESQDMLTIPGKFKTGVSAMTMDLMIEQILRES